jgi:predicted dehydrogenase
MENNKLRVGIAGYGVVGKKRHLLIDQNPNMKVVAVCDKNLENCGTVINGVKHLTNYEQLLNEHLDVLFVCLPNYLVAEVTISGLERNIHVFCEKPPGRDVNDVRRVIAAEEKCPNLKLKYGFNHRYHDSVKHALKIINSGEIGDIINMRGVYGKCKIMSFSSGWRAERKYAGGGILLDQGIHLVDLMRMFCDEFVEIKSFVSNSLWNHDVEDNAYALMRDAKGRVAMLHSSATQWQHRFSLDIALTKGFMVLRGILSGSNSYGLEELTIGRREESEIGSTREEVIQYVTDNSWKDEINEFADAITKDTKIECGTSYDALVAMKIVYRIYWSDSVWRDSFDIESPE